MTASESWWIECGRAAALDEWAKDVAPSTELRKWYGHVPEKFAQFESRYRDELATPTARAALEHLRALSEDHVLILLRTWSTARPQCWPDSFGGPR